MPLKQGTAAEYVVILPARSSQLAELMGLLARERVRFAGLSSVTFGESRWVRLLTRPRPKTFKRKLESRGWKVIEGEALSLRLENRPGALERVARVFADNSVLVLSLFGGAGADAASLFVTVDAPHRAAALVETVSY